MKKEIIVSQKLSKPLGIYSQAVKAEGSRLLFISGMTARDQDGNIVGKGDMRAQTRQVLENIKGVVEAAGMTLDNVLKATVYLHSMENFPKFNAVYGKYFDKVLPARETVEVSHLPRNVGVEISVICGK